MPPAPPPPPVPVWERCLEALRTQLENALGSTVVEVVRNAAPAADLSAAGPNAPARWVGIDDGGLEKTEDQVNATVYVADPTVRLLVATQTEAELGPALSALYAAVVVAAFGASRDLGGVADDINDGNAVRDADYTVGHGPALGLAVAFTIELQTKAGDPFRLPEED
jgi:hypothetical protein